MRPVDPIPRAQMLETAAELFATNGYAATSMRMLASALQVTPAALYHHFPSKDALYDAVIEYVFRAPVEPMARVVAEPGSDEQKLQRLIELGAEMIEAHPVGVRLLRRELLENDPARLHRLLDDNFNAPLTLMVQFIGHLFPGHDPLVVTGAIGSMLLGFYELRPIQKSLSNDATPPSPQEAAELIVRLVMNGFPASQSKPHKKKDRAS